MTTRTYRARHLQALGIIGGSCLTRLKALTVDRQEIISTPYGEPSAPLTFGRFDGSPVAFMPRHGVSHTIPPHRVNYRANLAALQELGAESVIALNTVGVISAVRDPGQVAVPDQVIDYTWGREQTLFDGRRGVVEHVDFTEPFAASLREELLQAAARAGDPVQPWRSRTASARSPSRRNGAACGCR